MTLYDTHSWPKISRKFELIVNQLKSIRLDTRWQKRVNSASFLYRNIESDNGLSSAHTHA